MVQEGGTKTQAENTEKTTDNRQDADTDTLPIITFEQIEAWKLPRRPKNKEY